MTMTAHAVEIHGLNKSFGRTKALDGLDLTVSPGDITGFLGPNGAGKSTTIRVPLGLLRADGGSVRLRGGDPWHDAVPLHRRIAYVPGDVTLWPNLTGLQAIDFLARLRGDGAVDTRPRDELIERFELDPHKKARTYSKGNRGQTIGWTVGLLLSGLAFGSMTKSLLDAAKGNELLQRVLAQQGTEGVYTTLTQFLAAAAAAYVVSAVLRVFTDEESGLGEAVLAGSVSRWRWLVSAVGAAIVGSTLMFFAGLGMGLGAGITIGEPQTIWRLTLAGVAFVPAMAAMAGVGALAVVLRHTWIGWLAVTFVVVSLYLGALRRLPHWLLDASPVGQTKAPTEYSVVALGAMVVAAAALTFAAAAIYRRRDAV